MQTVQSGVLVLYTSLVVANTVNKYGTANNNYTDVTFTNISMRQILGDNYDKFYKFNLILNSIIVPLNPVAVPVDNASAVMFYMSGLPFDISSSYSTITGTTTNNTLFGTMKLSLRGNTGVNADVATFPPLFFNTFLRPSGDLVDITISLRSSVATFTAGVPSFLLPTTTIYPRVSYSFSITPVLNTALLPFPGKEEQTLVNKQRLFR
jgi:hypothetical protein